MFVIFFLLADSQITYIVKFIKNRLNHLNIYTSVFY